jgi:hypothetical protein
MDAAGFSFFLAAVACVLLAGRRYRALGLILLADCVLTILIEDALGWPSAGRAFVLIDTACGGFVWRYARASRARDAVLWLYAARLGVDAVFCARPITGAWLWDYNAALDVIFAVQLAIVAGCGGRHVARAFGDWLRGRLPAHGVAAAARMVEGP